MKPTIEAVKGLFEGKMPSRGGYSSSFEYSLVDDTVHAAFEADWLPRYMDPVFIISDINTDAEPVQITVCENGHTETRGVEDFLQNWCGDYGC